MVSILCLLVDDDNIGDVGTTLALTTDKENIKQQSSTRILIAVVLVVVSVGSFFDRIDVGIIMKRHFLFVSKSLLVNGDLRCIAVTAETRADTNDECSWLYLIVVVNSRASSLSPCSFEMTRFLASVTIVWSIYRFSPFGRAKYGHFAC